MYVIHACVCVDHLWDVVYRGSLRQHVCEGLQEGRWYKLRVCCESLGGQSQVRTWGYFWLYLFSDIAGAFLCVPIYGHVFVPPRCRRLSACRWLLFLLDRAEPCTLQREPRLLKFHYLGVKTFFFFSSDFPNFSHINMGNLPYVVKFLMKSHELSNKLLSRMTMY